MPAEAEPFGWLLVLDLNTCDPERLVRKDHIQAYVLRLCDDILDMRRFGAPIVEWFGSQDIAAEGFSLVQLIETSSVVGHFSGHRRSAHIDVFSCKRFDPEAVKAFSVQYFAATSAQAAWIVRQ